MRTFITTLFVVLGLASALRADRTPADAPLEVDGITRIQVIYDAGPIQVNQKFKTDPPTGQSEYDLYLPPGYGDDPKEEFPVLFIGAGGGNGRIGVFQERVRKERFIAVMLQSPPVGTFDEFIGNFCAAHDDVVKRCRVAADFKFMTGYSGGGRAAGFCVGLRPGFAGIGFQGSNFYKGDVTSAEKNPRLGIFMGYSRKDQHLEDLVNIIPKLPPQNGFMCTFYEERTLAFGPAQVDQLFDFFEDWAYYQAPATKTGQPQYLKIWNELDARIAKTKDFEQADTIDEALAYAKWRGLDKQKDVAAKLPELKKQQAELAKNPSYKKETAARDAYRKIAAAEKTIYRQCGGEEAKLRNLMLEAAKAYEAVAAKHPGTLYASKASAKAMSLSKPPERPRDD